MTADESSRNELSDNRLYLVHMVGQDGTTVPNEILCGKCATAHAKKIQSELEQVRDGKWFNGCTMCDDKATDKICGSV